MKRVLPLLTAVSLSVAVAGGQEPKLTTPSPPISAYGVLSGLHGRAFDRAFLRWMMNYEAVTVDMAKSAIHGGVNSTAKAFAQSVLNARQSDIQQLQRWEKRWYGTQQDGRNASASIIGPLPGQTWDAWFLTFLPRQNEVNSHLLNLVAGHTRNPQLRAFAQAHLTAWNTENQQSQQLLKDLK